ncbi:hypothetical protein, conserved [Trypanosoma brucei gambiense DAL972]|uniref:Uncharacterized protein n=1 Tax=Trypanosoma brucei gambiense (strain MHOM/CI/86/DAL972) TaxID=679716 RepID=C9ZKB4_TRYB9|nr:hypothetical protein, conserved [Trypanosoma brucei gambiense DAL972]CBH09878.1 hypothetical protein, conserved [Trypanosoma brucei gambiense DAL972]|eukprot:XP_011772171.1 hypothetical protein, conserved [Trypanosoma brucei gambiense DAL972]
MANAALEENFVKAASLVREGNHIAAIGLYKTISSDEHITVAQKIRAFSNMSACYAAREQFAEALSAAKEALQMDDRNSKVHGRMAAAYHGLKHYEEASRHYARAYELDPNTILYKEQHQLVLELMRSGRGVASKDTLDSYYYRKGIEQGKEAMTKGEYLSAVRHFSKAIELHTKCASNGESNRGNGGGSIAADMAVLLCNRSAAYARAGRWSESLKDGMRAIEVHPTYARAFFRVGCAQHQLKRPQESCTALRRCLELDPSHGEAKNLMVEVEKLVAEACKTTEEREREREIQVREILERQNAEGATHAVGSRGRAHATSYVLCSYCNDGGHTREECPLLRRKRSRTS